MVDIPENVFELLVCSKCEELLRKGPVYQQNDGAAVCGVCQALDDAEPASRCLLYEATAQLLLFPCRYQEEGCPTTVPFEAVEKSIQFGHEDLCEYRPYVCPVVGSSHCDWSGRRNQIHQHCQQSHPDRLLSNPTVITPDIRRTQIANYIIPAFRLLFLLHTRICLSTAKLYYALRLLGSSHQAADYTFTLTVRRGDNVINWSRQVLPQGRLVLQEQSALKLCTNNLLGMLGGWDNASLSVEVKRRNQEAPGPERRIRHGLLKLDLYTSSRNRQTEPEYSLADLEQPTQSRQAELGQDSEGEQCSVCMTHTPRLFKNARGWLCARCAPHKDSCCNEGCDFQDIGKKRIKHSKWFCQQRTICPLVSCKAVLPPCTLSEHYTACRCIEVIPSRSRFLVQRNENCKWFLVQTSAGCVVCMCQYTEQAFWFTVRTPIPSEQFHLFRCEVQLECADLTRTVTPDQWYDKEWDWAVNYRNDQFFSGEVYVHVEVEHI